MARRSSAVYPVVHLPLLRNPLFNALFNHPSPSKSRLNKVMTLLSEHSDQLILLVPDAMSLQQYTTECHDELFVQSHIVREVGKNHYESLNNQTYTISKSFIVLPDEHTTVQMLSNQLIYSFNNYMSDKCLYKIINVSNPLVVPKALLPSTPRGADVDSEVDPDIDFNLLIREFPLIYERVGTIYRSFFVRLNLSNIDTAEKLVESFNNIIASGNSIFSDNLDKESVSSIMSKYSRIDINRSVFKYLEMNIYDKFWAQLCHLNSKDDFSLNSVYDELQYIAINQVAIPVSDTRSIDDIIDLEKRVVKAQTELESLGYLTGSEEQCRVLETVFEVLAGNSSTNADTLVGLLILVICRSKVANLVSHLAYIENFSYDSTKFEKGHLGYIVSTFGAVLSYLCEPQNVAAMKQHSQHNGTIWSLINDSEKSIHVVAELQEIFSKYDDYTSVPKESILYSRNREGQSLLSMAISVNSYRIFKEIIDQEKLCPLEDILSDKNIDNQTLLFQAMLADNQDMIDELMSIFVSSATEKEQIAYFNQVDDNNRNIGHVLFDIVLLKQVGRFINWKQKDSNDQTPLFTILRCYDHPDYPKLVHCTVKIVKDWYAQNGLKFDYRDHSDSKNNTILHVIKSDLNVLLDAFPTLNLNELNKKHLTPLMYYIKYNRTDNVRCILQDARLDLTKLDDKFYLKALDYAKVDIKTLIRNHAKANGGAKSETVKNDILRDDMENKEIEDIVDRHFIQKNFPVMRAKSFALTRIKTDSVNNDLCLFFKTMEVASGDHEDNTAVHSNIHNLRDYLKLLNLLKLENAHALLSIPFVNMVPALPSQSFKLNNFYRFYIQRAEVLLNMSNIVIAKNCSESKILHNFLFERGNLKDDAILDKSSSSDVKTGFDKVSNLDYIDDEIVAMKHFFDYGVDQLSAFGKTYDNFIKMFIFSNIKSAEIKDATEDIMKNVEVNDSVLPANALKLIDTVTKVSSEESSDARDFAFISAHKLVLFQCQELLQSIKSTLATKLAKWEESHSTLQRINAEIHRLSTISGSSLPQEQQSPMRRRSSTLKLSASGDHMASESNEEPSSQLSSPPSASLLFSSIVQTKKSRHAKLEKLQERKATVTQRLHILANELKNDQELIALRMNSFLDFKNYFIRQELKKYCESHIRDLKFGLALLQK